jgi:hypothetical protein
LASLSNSRRVGALSFRGFMVDTHVIWLVCYLRGFLAVVVLPPAGSQAYTPQGFEGCPDDVVWQPSIPD